MPRNFSELKSGGGGQFLCCPPTLKSVGGGGGASPRPPPIDAREVCVFNLFELRNSLVDVECFQSGEI